MALHFITLGHIPEQALPVAGANSLGELALLRIDDDGNLVSTPYAAPGDSLDGTGSSTGTGDTAVIAAQGAAVRIYVTTLIVSNSSATDTEVVIKSGTTARLTIPAPQKSGAIITLPRALRLGLNEALNFASVAGVTSMKVSAVGYKAA